jgi:hypothetical protein
MRLRCICTVVTVILVGTFQLLAGLSESPAVIFVTAGLGCWLPYYGIWQLLASEAQPDVDVYLPGVATIIGVVLGGSARRLAGLSQPMLVDWLAVLLAVLGSGTIVAIQHRARRAHCALCRQPLTPAYYQCLRCNRMICSRSRCWIGLYQRCSDCEQYQVPLFPAHADWWHRRLGPRLVDGRCLRCEQGAHACDLHQCGQCPWAMCTQCWDLENGHCTRCHWQMPDLPQSFRGLRTGRPGLAPHSQPS